MRANGYRFKYLVAFFLLLFFSLHGLAQTDRVTEDLHRIMEKHDAVGLSVAVVKNGKLAHLQSLGFKNLEKQDSLETDDLFRIASISKSFSAVSIMQLVEAGKLSLEDDVSNLIGFKVRNPKYPEKIITLKMLLSHTSSINDKGGYFTLDVIDPAKNPNWADSYNDYEPGQGYQYCNLNYNITGTIIEKISGERFDQYIKHHVLDPLQLYGGYNVDSLNASLFTTLYSYDPESKKYEASPMAYASKRDEINNYQMGRSAPVFSPTGGMKISVPDLVKYMMMHMNFGKYPGGRIISKRSAKLMQTNIAEKEGYGMALTNTDQLIEGEKLVGHTGSAYGLYSAMFFNPKDKFGFVVLTNGCNASYTGEFNDLIKETINSLYNNFISKS